QVRARQLLPRRQRDARWTTGAEDRLPADQALRRQPFGGDRRRASGGHEGHEGGEGAEGEKREAAGEGAAAAGEGEEVRGRDLAQDGQDVAGDALGRPRDPPDRQVHLQQRLDGLPARWLARESRRPQGADADGPAVCRRLAAARHQHPRRRDVRAGIDGAGVPPRVLQLPQGRRHVENPSAEMIAALLLSLAIQNPPERIAEIRVHGNATLTDEAVIALAGIAPGDTLEADGLEAIGKRLPDSGRFHEVQVRKRYRTLAMDEVALVLLVHEKQGLSPTGEPPSAMKRLRSRLMFFPILDYDDGYGWTYGGRTTIVDILGKGTHVSVPLSWGGTRRAAVEAEHTFHSGPFTRLTGSFGIVQRENPHYEIDDRRTTLSGRAERRLFDHLTLGAEAGASRVTFEPSHDRFWSGGADVTLDTRNDPGFPSDAVLAGASWSRLNALGDTRALWSSAAIDRYRLEARGYKRLFGQWVIAVRAQYDTASAPLPPYEQFLLGGS